MFLRFVPSSGSWRQPRALARRARVFSVPERAETLYLYQHRLLMALISTIDTIEPHDPELADRLYDSEDELNTVCRALQQASSRRIEGHEIEGDLRWQVFASLDACAEKAREVETLLREVDPETAEQVLLGLGHLRTAEQ